MKRLQEELSVVFSNPVLRKKLDLEDLKRAKLDQHFDFEYETGVKKKVKVEVDEYADDLHVDFYSAPAEDDDLPDVECIKCGIKIDCDCCKACEKCVDCNRPDYLKFDVAEGERRHREYLKYEAGEARRIAAEKKEALDNQARGLEYSSVYGWHRGRGEDRPTPKKKGVKIPAHLVLGEDQEIPQARRPDFSSI